MFHGVVVTGGTDARFEVGSPVCSKSLSGAADGAELPRITQRRFLSGLHFNSDTELYLTCPGLSLSHDPSVCSRDHHFHLRL